ncbi:hypothetical protein C8R44DRAFT_879063 [Mycena epipterygia]|nr:hypothetical protein C8R44DRAFT_879063 [Mycena epipterygia]
MSRSRFKKNNYAIRYFYGQQARTHALEALVRRPPLVAGLTGNTSCTTRRLRIRCEESLRVRAAELGRVASQLREAGARERYSARALIGRLTFACSGFSQLVLHRSHISSGEGERSPVPYPERPSASPLYASARRLPYLTSPLAQSCCPIRRLGNQYAESGGPELAAVGDPALRGRKRKRRGAGGRKNAAPAGSHIVSE